jgi:hypothetical protein
LAREATARWTGDVLAVAEISTVWGTVVEGRRDVVQAPEQDQEKAVAAGAIAQPVNVLNVGLVRKKKKDGEEEQAIGRETAAAPVNMLSGDLIRKRPKEA